MTREPSEYELLEDAFDAIADSGPVATEELVTALMVAEREFEAESYDGRPFRLLIARLTKEGRA